MKKAKKMNPMEYFQNGGFKKIEEPKQDNPIFKKEVDDARKNLRDAYLNAINNKAKQDSLNPNPKFYNPSDQKMGDHTRLGPTLERLSEMNKGIKNYESNKSKTK